MCIRDRGCCSIFRIAQCPKRWREDVRLSHVALPFNQRSIGSKRASGSSGQPMAVRAGKTWDAHTGQFLLPKVRATTLPSLGLESLLSEPSVRAI
eukprot:3564744-Pyramimonas_sp.AAC.1